MDFPHRLLNPGRPQIDTHDMLQNLCAFLIITQWLHSSTDRHQHLFRPEAVLVMPLTISLASCNMPWQVYSSFLHTVDSC